MTYQIIHGFVPITGNTEVSEIPQIVQRNFCIVCRNLSNMVTSNRNVDVSFY